MGAHFHKTDPPDGQPEGGLPRGSPEAAAAIARVGREICGRRWQPAAQVRDEKVARTWRCVECHIIVKARVSRCPICAHDYRERLLVEANQRKRERRKLGFAT